MRLMAKNYPFIHKPYTLCLLCVLRGEFLQWTQAILYVQRHGSIGNREYQTLSGTWERNNAK
jgi:hypothetical protein